MDELEDSKIKVTRKKRDSDDETLYLDSRRVARPLLTEDDSPNDAEEYAEEVSEAAIQDKVVWP